MFGDPLSNWQELLGKLPEGRGAMMAGEGTGIGPAGFGSANSRILELLARVKANLNRCHSSSHEVLTVQDLNRFPEFAATPEDTASGSTLMQYVQSLNPEMVAQLSRPASPEVAQLMERNILGLLGGLPPEGFEVTIATNREHLGRLLASAMMSGYFLRNVEQRLTLEQSFQGLTLAPAASGCSPKGDGATA